jgi:hypothetical protein
MKYILQGRRLNRASWSNILDYSLNENIVLIMLTLIYVSASIVTAHIYHYKFTNQNDFLLSIHFARIVYISVCLFLFNIMWKTGIQTLNTLKPFSWSTWTSRTSNRFFLLIKQKHNALSAMLLLGILFPIFALTQNHFKAMIPIINPFKWDPIFAQLDYHLFLKNSPYTVLPKIFFSQSVLKTIDFWYAHAWFLISMIIIIFLAIHPNRLIRQKFFISYMLSWMFLGGLLATIFSSVGPIFFEHFYHTNVNHYHQMWATIQQAQSGNKFNTVQLREIMLSLVHNEKRYIPISAFPSLHIASTTIYLLVARELSKPLWRIGLLFWLIIMLGSVLLMWHYAIDSIAGAIGAYGIWRLADPIARKTLKNAEKCLPKTP